MKRRSFLAGIGATTAAATIGMIEQRNRVVQVSRFGDPERLEVIDAPLPTAGSGEVRVRVLASSLNYTEVLIRRHLYPQTMGLRPPFVMGYDVVGTIDQLGEGVHDFRIGDRVADMKQRVGIARALAMEPKVLLLDEPFGALDALTRAHLQDSVMALHQKLGNTILMITHDVDEAVLLSDRIVMMTNGPSARIGEVLDVPLARPRKRLELATNATYLKCRQRVLEFLYERHRFVEAA